MRALIAAAGGEVLYLPPYSPDLNPIEQAFQAFAKLPSGVIQEPSVLSAASSQTGMAAVSIIKTRFGSVTQPPVGVPVPVLA